MPRLTAPHPRQITRAINSAVGASNAAARPLDHHADAILMPKYAELLRSRRSSDHTDSSRGMTTTHRPTPQPSITNRSKPLMQTFSTSRASSATPISHLDAFFLPSVEALTSNTQAPAAPRMPTLPDNFAVQQAQDAPVIKPSVTIIACDPDRVVSGSALSEVNGLDGVVLNFALGGQAEEQSHQGMVKDMWKGL